VPVQVMTARALCGPLRVRSRFAVTTSARRIRGSRLDIEDDHLVDVDQIVG
jgi:hypothetical protein